MRTQTKQRARAQIDSLGVVLTTLVVLIAMSAPVAAEIEGHATIHLQPTLNPEEAVRSISLERNKSAFVTTDHPVRRVSVGDPSIVDVSVLSPRELQLVPQAVGATNVVLWDSKGEVQAVFEVDVSATHTQIERDIHRILGLTDIAVHSAGNSIALQGSTPDALSAERAVELATAYYSAAEEPPTIVNLLDVGGHQQVMIEIVVAEMSRTLGREMGTNFAAVIERNGEPIRILSLLNNLTQLDDDESTASTVLVSEAINLIGSFNAGSGMYTILMDVLRERGMGRVLAEPTVIARSGETARFLAGGEIPIPVAQGGAFGSITIEFKEFGVGVLFTPTVLSDGRIHLKVSPEVSEPDFTLGVSFSGTSVPGFNTRRASTAVELGDGETFAVAGLLSDRMNHIATKYPILGDVPVLGALFRSLQFQRNETELVILVTPRLVGPLGPHENLPALPTDSYVQPNDLEFYLLGWMEGSPKRLETRDAGKAGLITPGGYRLDTTAPEDSP